MRQGVEESAFVIGFGAVVGDQTERSVRTSEDDGSRASLLFGRSGA